MAKYARGKKSYAISDISGLRVKYSKLKTTWDGLRVSPEDFEPKHPQLTPAKNVVDATALMDGRPDNDPENVVVFVGFTQDWTIDRRLLPPVGVPAFGGVGNNEFLSLRNQTGVGGDADVGSVSLFITIDIVVTGAGGTAGVGSELGEVKDLIGGVGGAGGVGTANINGLPAITGAGGTGGVGTIVAVEAFGWGQGGWNQGAWGDQEGSPHVLGAAGGAGGVGAAVGFTLSGWGESGYGQNTWNADIQPFPASDNGTGNTGTVSILIATTWGSNGYGDGQWN